MYESRSEELISRKRFALRVLVHLLVAMAFVTFSLLMGVAGYLWIEGGGHWHDVTLNMAMIASGIGPIMLPQTVKGKIFLAIYGGYISVVYVVVPEIFISRIHHPIRVVRSHVFGIPRQ